MRMRTPIWLAVAVALAVAAPLAANAAAISAPFRAARAPHPLALDASLSDPAWQLGRVDPAGFWDLTKRTTAPLATQAYLLYDDRYVYVAFHAEQDRLPIIASQRTNDVGFGLDDFVGVAIDTSGTGTQVYFFETTPRGTRYEQASDNVRYVARWRSATKVDAAGWNAVFIIPLSVMRLTPGQHVTWRFDFVRSIAAQGEHYTWAYDGLMVDAPVGQGWPAFSDARYWPSLAIDGLVAQGRAARPGASIDVYGLESAGSDHDRFQQADGTFRPQPSRPAGADFTVPITDTMNLVGTVDPDFSNVEVDQLTIVPQEFPRQLQEYRPFFAQGANFLMPSAVGFSSPTSPNNLVFDSSRIGPFDRGAKIEGTFGMQSLGLLSFRGFDETTGNTFDDIAYGYRHALPDRSFIYWVDGVDAHHSIDGDDSTTDFGLSGDDVKTGFQWGEGQQIEVGEHVPITGVTHLNNAFIGVVKPNWETFVGTNDVGPNFNPIDGLTFDSDIRGMQGFSQVSGATPELKNFAASINWDRWFDRSGFIHEADVLGSVSATFDNGFSIDNLGPSIGILRSYDIPSGPGCAGPIVGTSTFTGFPCYLDGRDERFDLFQAAFGYKDGTPHPLDVSTSFGPFGGNYTQLYSATTSRPLGRFSVGLEYDGTYERSLDTGALDSQWLRRVSIGASLGADSNLSVSFRSINGLGGFAPATGANVALGYHRRFATGDELYIDYGTPAAFSTLHRFTVKYVYHAGARGST